MHCKSFDVITQPIKTAYSLVQIGSLGDISLQGFLPESSLQQEFNMMLS